MSPNWKFYQCTSSPSLASMEPVTLPQHCPFAGIASLLGHKLLSASPKFLGHLWHLKNSGRIDTTLLEIHQHQYSLWVWVETAVSKINKLKRTPFVYHKTYRAKMFCDTVSIAITITRICVAFWTTKPYQTKDKTYKSPRQNINRSIT